MVTVTKVKQLKKKYHGCAVLLGKTDTRERHLHFCEEDGVWMSVDDGGASEVCDSNIKEWGGAIYIDYGGPPVIWGKGKSRVVF